MQYAATGPGRWPQGYSWAVGLAGLVQVALFAYATGPGLAGTGDSRYYLHAAQTLRDTGHLLNPDGSAYRYWPPLYPVLLRGCGSVAGVRGLHGIGLLGSLLLWSWLGRRVLPVRRATVLPWLLALSTPWLLVGKFVWAESVFLLLFAAYAAALFQWLRTGRWRWWGVATAIGFLLPLQRTLGLFLLAGAGAGLLVGSWNKVPGRRGPLALHLAASAVGGMLWQWYALVVATGPSRYHASRGAGQLLSSAADYGFVLGRWLLPLPMAGRALLPHGIWVLALLALFGLLWPRRSTGAAPVAAAAAATKEAGWLEQFPGWRIVARTFSSRPRAIKAARMAQERELKVRATAAYLFPDPEIALSSSLLLRTLWSAALSLVGLVAALTVFAQSAAGIHDAERYASVLFGPVVVLALAAWPARAPRWLSWAGLAMWLLSAALRVGHVAADLRRLPVLPAGSFTGPGPHGERVGAAGQ